MQAAFLLLMSLYAGALYTVMVESILRGWWARSLVAVLLASPALLTTLALTLERRPVDEALNLSTLPWSLAIGDTFCLTAVAAIAALCWRGLEIYNRPGLGWRIVALLSGVVAGSTFHYIDGKNYIRVGAGAMVDAPTTLAHDFITIPVLFGAFLCIGLPVMRHKSWHRWVILTLLGVWVALCVVDAHRGLDPWLLHVLWNTETFSPAK